MNPSPSIGDILLARGRLGSEQLQAILLKQQENGQPFGEAAITLGLLTHEDIDYALSKQFDYAYLPSEDSSLSPELVTAYKPFSRVGQSIRELRTQLMLRWFNEDPRRKALAVVSPAAGEGRSFTAANLAVVFAQQNQRTLLIDADLRSAAPRSLGGLFRLSRAAGLSDILADRADLGAAQPVPGLPQLSVLQSGPLPPNPQELLGRRRFGEMLSQASEQFDILLLDTPPGESYADAQVVATRVGAAVMVLRRDHSLLSQASRMEQQLAEGGATLVGTVLNEF
jgi:receptor protein-tyrosine kinase